MTKIARDERQITFYYNPDSSVGKQTLAYLEEAKIPVLRKNILKNHPTGSQWLEIADDLGIDVSDLVLKDHPVFTKQYQEADLDTNGWLKVMKNHPEVIDQPIAIRGEKVLLVRAPTEILRLINIKTHEEEGEEEVN